jgi:hypothetical protein
MRLLNEPQPLHHASVVRSFEDIHASFTARVLLLRRPDGTVEPYLPFIKYQRDFRLRSRSWQDTPARALGLLWDFSVAHRDSGWSPHRLLKEFAYTLIEGTFDSKLARSRDLMWPGISVKRARGLVRSIEAFAEWCSTQDDGTSPLAREEVPLIPGTAEHATRLLVWSRIRRISMLQHIKSAPTTRMKSHVEFARTGGGKEMETAKHFPAHMAEALLWRGHMRPGAAANPDMAARQNIRDMMMALLDGWGGLRRSEGLHLWLNDVTEDKEKLGHAFVVLNHPEEAKVEWKDPLSGVRRWIPRKEKLARLYGLKARNVVKRGHYHVGWKGMALNQDHQAFIFWIDDTAAALFWTLYLAYIWIVRPAIMKKRKDMGGRDHPFLFVSEEINPVTGFPGEPYSEKAYERNHEAAVCRLDLKHEKAAGTTTHGLRHLYGHTMRKLGVDAHVIRQGLHHVNLLSQTIYTIPMAEDVSAILRAAQQRIKDGDRPVVSLGENTAAALLRLNQSLSHGGLLE